jgi:hypothetical protein
MARGDRLKCKCCLKLFRPGPVYGLLHMSFARRRRTVARHTRRRGLENTPMRRAPLEIDGTNQFRVTLSPLRPGP